MLHPEGSGRFFMPSARGLSALSHVYRSDRPQVTRLVQSVFVEGDVEELPRVIGDLAVAFGDIGRKPLVVDIEFGDADFQAERGDVGQKPAEHFGINLFPTLR